MKKALLIAFLSIASSGLWAEAIDLNGVARTVGADEYAAEFTNTSETLAELTIDVAEETTFSGVISGNIRLIKKGAGKLIVTSASTYTGGTDIQAGTVAIQNPDALSTGDVAVTASASGQISLASAMTFRNNISVTGATDSKVPIYLEHASGAAIYAGNITVSGTLRLRRLNNYESRFTGRIETTGDLKVGASNAEKNWKYYFDGPVVLNAGKGTVHNNYANSATLVFSHPENAWGLFQMYSRTPSFVAPYALPANSWISSNQGGCSPSVSVKGDQKFRYIKSRNSDKTSTITMSGTEISTVTLWPETSVMNEGYNLNGPMNIVFDPPSDDVLWNIRGGSSSMDGSFTVARGIVQITNTFSKISGFHVKNTGKLHLSAGCKITSTKSLDISVDEGARLSLEKGVQLTAGSFVYGSVRGRGGYCYYQSQKDDGTYEWHEISVDAATALADSGYVFVEMGEVVETSATWDGEAENADITEAQNWNGDALPDFETGGLTATFASSGVRAEVGRDITLNGIILNATQTGEDGITNVFTLAGNGNIRLMSGGLSISQPKDNETAYRYDINTPIVFGSDQLWSLNVAPKTALNIYGALSSLSPAYVLAFGGTAVVNMYTSSSFAGAVTLTNTTVNVYADDALGSHNPTQPYRISVSKDGRLNLHNVTMTKGVTVTSVDSNSENYPVAMVISSAGTTNYLKGAVTYNNNSGVAPQAESVLSFEGGLTFGRYISCYGAATSKIVVREKPMIGGVLNLRSGILELCVEGNETKQNNMISLCLLGGTLRTTVPHAFWHFNEFDAANGSRINANIQSKWDLCGGDQGIAGIEGSTKNGEITSEEPAVLYLKQYKAHTLAANVSGQVGLSKTGNYDFTLNRKYSTAGSLEVTGGNLILGADCVWNGTNVFARGTGVLKINARTNLPRETVLTLGGTAKIDVAEGVQLSVAEIRQEDDEGNAPRLKHGVYTAATHPELISGNGSIIAGNLGLRVIIK
jgi:autotransporter-associated beta strand protein